jgi:tetratricopeptide (TPR) repeat protein
VKKVLKNRYVVAAFVSLATCIANLRVLNNDFVSWDDNVYVFDNPHIRSLDLPFFKWAFFSFYSYNWHPLTWLSHAMDYAVWGLNPFGHHLTNLMLHGANAFLVVLLTMRLLEQYKAAVTRECASAVWDERWIVIVGGVTGFLFGLHPLHVESVAWVSERKDLLCAFFFLLSIMSYITYAADAEQGAKNKGNRARSIFVFAQGSMFSALCFFILALLSKPMAVSLPFVFLIIDWNPLRRITSLKTFRAALVEKIPFMLLSVISSALTFTAQKAGGAMTWMSAVPLTTRTLVAAKSLFAYLWKAALPFNLVPYYPYPTPQEMASQYPAYVALLFLAAGITAACLALARKKKVWLTVWCYYVVTLMPVIGIVQVGRQSMADRYMYLPSIGPFLIAALATVWVWDRVTAMGRGQLLAKFFFAIAVIVVLISLPFLTVLQTGVWKNSFTLWNFVIEKEHDRVPFAYNSRGLALQEMGRYDEAIGDYNKAIVLDPLSPEPYINLGMVYGMTGRHKDSLQSLKRALAIDPNSTAAYFNLATLYRKTGKTDEAIENYGKVIDLDPNYRAAFRGLGATHMSLGRTDDAIMAYAKLVSLSPADPEALTSLGDALARKGAGKDAMEQYQSALSINPDYVDAHYGLGSLYANSGRTQEAMGHFEAAVKLKPDNAFYRNILGISYGQKGLFDKAVEQFEAAVRLAPSESSYRENLERALKLKKSTGRKE